MKDIKVVAIIQARRGSSRLPDKIFKDIGGKNSLQIMLDRLSNSCVLDEICIATTDRLIDDLIEEKFQSSVKIFRGDEDDVLSRYLGAAKKTKASIVVRLTADCPFVDPDIVDTCVNKLIEENLDYVSNTTIGKTNFPDGFDVEVFTYKSLTYASLLSILDSYREHVTFAYTMTTFFKVGSVNTKLQHSLKRLTLDYLEDLDLIRKIYVAMGDNKWSWDEICNFLDDNPHLLEINNKYIRNASWLECFDGEKKRLFLNRLPKFMNSREELIPNGSQLLSKRSDQFSKEFWPDSYIKAKGSVIVDSNFRVFQDYSISGIGANTLGYANENIDNEVIETINNGSSCSINSWMELEAAGILLSMHSWADQARFARAGGEANAIAIRIARAHSEKEMVLFSGYHGWHDWYLSSSLSDQDALQNHLLDFVPSKGVPKCLDGTSIGFKWGDILDLEEKIQNNLGKVAAIIMEPMRYEEPQNNYLEKVRGLCDQHDIVLIFDEISSGFRFSNRGYHMEKNVFPDMAVFAKSISNGYPFSAIIGRKNIMESVSDTFISSTSYTESIGFSAAIATMDYYKNNNVSNILFNVGKTIQNMVIKTSKYSGLKIRITGLPQLWSWCFDIEKKDNKILQTIFTEKMISKGFLFCNRFYANIAMRELPKESLETALIQVFTEIKDINLSDRGIRYFLKGSINNLGVYKKISE